MAAAAVAAPPAAPSSVPQLAHASTSASAPAHVAAHHSRTARTQLFVHGAAHTPSLVVRGADHAVVQALPFPDAPHRNVGIGALTCGEGGADVGALIAAALQHRIIVWARTSTGLWKQHSAFELAEVEDGHVTALDLREGKLLVGAERSVSLWTLDANAALQPWRRAWRRRCPQPILAANWSPDGLVFAAATRDDDRVLLWACGAGKPDERPRPRLRAQLTHSRPLRSFAWRQAPDSSGQTEALYTTTIDGTIRIWAPVIDTPGQPRLWAAMCSSVMGGAEPSYMAAQHVAGALEATKAAYARQTELAAVGLRTDSQREAETREGAVRRLEAVGEAPDLFLGLSDGNLTLKALANVDRAPPTLHSIYTVLSTPSSLPPVPASLEPLAVPSGAELSAPAAVLRLQHAEYKLAPAAFFEGAGGLHASAPPQVPHTQLIERLLCAPGHARVASVAHGESRIWTGCRRGEERGMQSTDPGDGRIVALAEDSHATYDGSSVTLHRSDGSSSSHAVPRDAALAAVLLCDEDPILVTSDASVRQGNSEQRLDVKSAPQLVFASTSTIFTLGVDGTLESWARSERTWTRSSRLDCTVGKARQAQASETGFVALASTKEAGQAHLSIWDTRASAFSSGLEHAQDWAADICALAWAPASFAPLLAVATAAGVTLLAPRRRAINEDVRLIGSARWEALAHIELGARACEPIIDVAWLANGLLLVATQAEIHAYGPYLARSDAHVEGDETTPERPLHIAELVAKQCGPLPDFHPLLLWQLMQWNRLDVAKKVVMLLAKAAKTSEDGPLQPESLPCEVYLEEQTESKKPGRATQGQPLFDDTTETQRGDSLEYSSGLVADLLKTLESRSVGDLAAAELAQLRVLLRTIDEVNEQRRSLDDNGLRYLVALRCFVNQPTSDPLARLKYRDMLWAYHSTSQEVLQGALTQAYDGQLTWPAARASGIFMWLRSHSELRAVAEQVARAQYMAGNDRDPVKCSLLYYALGKHRLVQNLWRQAAWHPEQQKMLAFLAKDFSEERWRTAALKNAFALLSQRRFEFAATFFMLGDSLRDAVNVCVRNLDDLPLALALARVREGRDDGPVFSDLLCKRVLPLAFAQGYRWLASWAFWLLKRRDLAVRVILVPFTELLADPDVAAMLPSDASAGDGHYNDASLAILFGQLKHKSLQTLRGTATISVQRERAFVLHINRVLRSEGCHALGLALLSNWSFDPPDLGSGTVPPSSSLSLVAPPANAASSDIAAELFSGLSIDTPTEAPPPARSPPASPRVAMRRRSSLMRRASRVIDDSELLATQQSMRAAAPPAAVFEEPAASAVAEEPAKTEVPKAKEEEPSKPPTRLPTMLKSSNAATQQQGAQEFSFDSFGF